MEQLRQQSSQENSLNGILGARNNPLNLESNFKEIKRDHLRDAID